MRVQNVRRWQWLLVGLLCGLAVGATRVGWGPAYQDEVSRTVPQELFERGVSSSPASAFHLSDLVVHPPDPDGAMWVTGELHEQSQSQRGEPSVRTDPFKFRAAVPYHPGVALDFAGSTSEVTVEDYLTQIAARVPQAQLRFRRAWDERPAATIWMCTAIGVVLIGVVWPLILRRLAGPPIEGIDFIQLSGVPAVRPGVAGAPRSGEQLDALNSQLESGLAASAAPASTSRSDSPLATSIRSLELAPVDGPPILPVKSKAFEGEYYPTETHARKPE